MSIDISTLACCGWFVGRSAGWLDGVDEWSTGHVK